MEANISQKTGGGRARSRGRSRSRRRSRSRAGPSGVPPAISNAGATCRISKREVMEEITLGASGVYQGAQPLNPSTSTFFSGWLKSVANLFEQMRWEKCIIRWEPSLGTTQGGNVFLGFDWDNSVSKDVTKITVATVSACTPNITTPLWKEASMRADTRFQKQRWLQPHASETSLGTILAYVSGPASQKAGYVVLDYTVVFQGTRLT